jgi:hypothetical protein
MDLSGSGLGPSATFSDNGDNLSSSVKDGEFRDLLEE